MDNIEEFIVDVSNHVENKILNEEMLHLSLFEQKIYELKFIKKKHQERLLKNWIVK